MKHHCHGTSRTPASPKYRSPPPSPSRRVAMLLAQRVTLRSLAILILICSVTRFHATSRSAFASTSPRCYHPLLGESTRCLPLVTGMIPTAPPVSEGTHWRRFPRVVTLVQLNLMDDIVFETTWQSRNRTVTDMGNPKARKRIAKRDDLELDTVENEFCRLRYAWQKSTYPTCNSVHEFDATSPTLARDDGRQKLYRMMGYGFWRDVWIAHSAGEKAIFKTMRWIHDYTPRNFDRMRRDAVVMEHLTASPFVIDIYSFCGTSSFSEYGEGGDIPDALWPSNERPALTQLEKLRIATQTSIGLATAHNTDQEGESSIAHTDVSPGQYIKVNGIYKLNDFNRARFIAYAGDEACPFSIGNNPGKNRSPEEYAYEPQTEKADVYSLGNIFYMLLQGEWPFEDVSSEMASALVQNGTRPTIYLDLWYSDDPVDMVLKEVMLLCHVQDPAKRGTARQVQNVLMEKMRELDPGRLETWGLS